MKIAVYAQKDFWGDFEIALAAFEVNLVSPDEDLLTALRRFDAELFDRFVIMDEAASDAAVVTALREFLDGPRADRSYMMPVFVSNAFRSQPSAFYSCLIKELGVEQVIARDGDGYDYFAALVRSFRYPLRRSDVLRLCAVQEQEARCQPVRHTGEQSEGARLVDYRVPKHIVVAQGQPKSGSTHLTFACAKALDNMKFDVAVVISEDDLRCMRQFFPKAPYAEDLGRLEFGRLDIYSGNNPNDVPPQYDYVVCDIGTASWLYRIDDPRHEERSKAQLGVFRRSNLHILSTFVTPSGAWKFGGEQLEEFGARLASSTTFAVFGASVEAVEANIRKRVESMSEGARYATTPYLPLPLFSKHADPAIVEMLRPVLPAKRAERALDGVRPEEQNLNEEEKPKKSLLEKMRGAIR